MTFKRSKRPVSKYDDKEKEISVDVFVSKEDFWNKSEIDRKKYIVTSTIEAVKKIETKLRKQKVTIDFQSIKSIIEKAKNEFINK